MPQACAHALDRCTDVLGTVVATYDLWLAAPGNDLPQGPDHTLCGQREVDLDAQCFAVEVIHDVEQSEAPAIFELVVHEIHGPDLVDGLRHAQRFGFVAHQPFAWLDAQVQLQLPADPEDTLVVPVEALDVAKVQVTQPKPQLRLLSVRRSSQSAIRVFSALSLTS